MGSFLSMKRHGIRYLSLLAFLLIVDFTLCVPSFGDNGPAKVIVSPKQVRAMKEISSEKQSTVEVGIGKKGGALTPEPGSQFDKRPQIETRTPGDRDASGFIETDGTQPEGNRVTAKTSETYPGEKTESLFDNYRTVGSYQDISTDIKPFGYDFFSGSSGGSSVPRTDIPVSSDYILGPGDEVKILFWGRMNEQYDLTINRDGNITIPKLGPQQVAGMRFVEMKKLLSERSKQIIGADLNVSMGALKSIQIFVLGEVRKPGSYTIGPFSTITDAILASGGPTRIGSLRNIQLKRNNKVIVEMDYYDFLLKGNKTRDKNLQSGDVIFVPTVGPLVGVAGDVKRPAIYEMKNEHDLMSLFEMAGGTTPTAYTQQIQVERIRRNENQIVIDINDKNLQKAKEFILQDGDLVKVFSIVDMDVNVVLLEGNVKRPGKYEYKPGMRIRDLIKNTSDLLPETYFEYAFIKRLKSPKLETELIPFNPGRLLFEDDDAVNIELEPQDSIYIFSKWVFKGKPNITVEGEVRRKGEFKLLDNYRVKDAILDAGGLAQDASLRKGEIFRFDEQGDSIQIYFNIGLAMQGDMEENIPLKNRDKIVVHSIWENKYKYTVSIDGEVRSPGRYPLTKGMKVSDLVFSAGNMLETAYMEETEVSCYTSSNGKKLNIQKINLGLALENDPEHNIELGPSDRVFVRRKPNWQEEMFFNLSGELKFPGSYPIEKGAKLSSLIERAGGFTDNAYLRGAMFTRLRVKKMQQKSLDEMILRLEREVLYESSKQVSKARTDDEVKSRNAELSQKQKFIESLKKLKATGRLSIRLADLDLLKGSEYDIKLEAGDALDVPMKNSVVDIVGAVMSRGSFIYCEKSGYKDYIDMSGGFTRHADKDNVYVMKVDGSAKKLSLRTFKWNASKSGQESDGFGGTIKEIEPGDTIVVPERIEHIAWLRDFKDVSTILYQIAIATGVAMLIF